jgi:hypothetical protein
MGKNDLTARWKMNNPKSFSAEKDGYVMKVEIDRIYPVWVIEKNGVIIDHSMNHTPTKSELSARVQAERNLNKILNL